MSKLNMESAVSQILGRGTRLNQQSGSRFAEPGKVDIFKWQKVHDFNSPKDGFDCKLVCRLTDTDAGFVNDHAIYLDDQLPPTGVFYFNRHMLCRSSALWKICLEDENNSEDGTEFTSICPTMLQFLLDCLYAPVHLMKRPRHELMLLFIHKFYRIESIMEVAIMHELKEVQFCLAQMIDNVESSFLFSKSLWPHSLMLLDRFNIVHAISTHAVHIVIQMRKEYQLEIDETDRSQPLLTFVKAGLSYSQKTMHSRPLFRGSDDNDDIIRDSDESKEEDGKGVKAYRLYIADVESCGFEEMPLALKLSSSTLHLLLEASFGALDQAEKNGDKIPILHASKRKIIIHQ